MSNIAAPGTSSPSPLVCSACGAEQPFALLVPASGDSVPSSARPRLMRHDAVVGRSPDCDIVLADSPNVSRRHAQLLWRGDHLAIQDLGSSSGSFVDGRQLRDGDEARLEDGCVLELGEARWVYREAFPARNPVAQARVAAAHDPGLSSLDPAEVIRAGLELLRKVSGMQRAYLIASTASEPLVVAGGRLQGLLTRLDDPELAVSRSSIAQAVASGGIVSRVIDPSDDIDSATTTMRELDLRRIWVCPVRAPGEPPAAVIYLDSQLTAPPLAESAEAQVQVLAGQIGMALRNALLFAEVKELNEGLERKVAERTHQLEESRAQLVAQDRLATLGRLVAGIAHELNNPAGAIVSLSGTLDRLLPGVRAANERLARLKMGPEAHTVAREWFERAGKAAQEGAPDSRRRRELEVAWRQALESRGARAGEVIAAKMARTGLDPAMLSADDPLASDQGLELAAIIEDHHTFRRSLVSLNDCATNVARIVTGLKTYAHLDKSAAEVADLRRGLQAALDVIQPRIPAGIVVETHLDPVPPFLQRPGELIQVWTNLLDNALRAMGQSGTLTLACHEGSGQAVVEVTDSGSGVPEALGNRIFDLDVTTRGPSAGLGLGLAICKNIVEQNHGGRISFESRPGRTTFRVSLPLAQG